MLVPGVAHVNLSYRSSKLNFSSMIQETKRRLNCSHTKNTRSRLHRRRQELAFLHQLGCRIVMVHGSYGSNSNQRVQHISQYDILTVQYKNQTFHIKLGSSKYSQSIGGLMGALPQPTHAHFRDNATKQLSQIGIISSSTSHKSPNIMLNYRNHKPNSKPMDDIGPLTMYGHTFKNKTDLESQLRTVLNQRKKETAAMTHWQRLSNGIRTPISLLLKAAHDSHFLSRATSPPLVGTELDDSITTTVRLFMVLIEQIMTSDLPTKPNFISDFGNKLTYLLVEIRNIRIQRSLFETAKKATPHDQPFDYDRLFGELPEPYDVFTIPLKGICEKLEVLQKQYNQFRLQRAVLLSPFRS